LSPERAAAKQRRRSLAAQFLAKRSLSEKELAEVEKSARRHFDLHQYEKVVEAIGQVPDEQRPARLQGLLADACTKTAEVAALVTAIDEAESRGDKAAALEKSGVLLKLQPGNPRACEVRNQASGGSLLAKIQNASSRTLWVAGLVGLALLAALIVALLAH
jgi:hypothetical protein